MTGEFQRYLRAKRTVDDRALDRRLVGRVRDRLAERATDADGAFSVLEVGAGIGTMVARWLEWDVFPAGEIHYTAVDIERSNVDAIGEYLREWASRAPVTVRSGDGTITVAGTDRRVIVEPVAADAVEYASREPADYDLLVGTALLDIVDHDAIPRLLSALDAGGIYYFPLTFDGGTRFRPRHPADRAVEGHYHDHMDTKPGGNSRAGGDVLARLQQRSGVSVEAAGSDWIVTPTDGEYRADEAYFLDSILDTVERAVTDVTDGSFDDLDAWLADRRSQLEAGTLVYVTHQLDLLGRVTDPAGVDGEYGRCVSKSKYCRTPE